MTQDKDKSTPSLADQVFAFHKMELPGQPRIMHMGTSHLVSALWARCQELERASAVNSLDAHRKCAEALRKHEAFWQRLQEHFHGDCILELDGADFQELAAKCGLLREEPYDPKKHGPNDVDAEAGDPWYVATNEAKTALSKLENPNG